MKNTFFKLIITTILCGFAITTFALPAAPKSTVIIVRDSKVQKADGTIDKVVLQQMLNVAIEKFYNVKDPKQGWQQAFNKKDKVAIKVNALNAYFAPPYAKFKGITHPELAFAIANGLISAGVKPKHIVIFDRQALGMGQHGFQDVLKRGGYYSAGKPKGIKVRENGKYGPEVTLSNGAKINFRKELYDATKIINAPVLKAHPGVGVTFSLKNHFGSFKPANMKLEHHATQYASAFQLHPHAGIPGVAALNSQPLLKNKTALIIGDMLQPQYRAHYYDPEDSWQYDGIIIGTDPVAVDSVAWHILKQKRKQEKIDYIISQPLAFWYMATPAQRKTMEVKDNNLKNGGVAGAYIHDCAQKGLGNDDMKNIDLQIINIG
ncbi:MAG: DUF362 domain-containing protein [Gammaproteobacteria bacterium]|nr:DUF362 domain-containing protein [Gammaproteobacteria bacterium]